MFKVYILHGAPRSKREGVKYKDEDRAWGVDGGRRKEEDDSVRKVKPT